jgi:hypothetical protein
MSVANQMMSGVNQEIKKVLAVKTLVAQNCGRLAKCLYRQIVTFKLSGGTKVSHQGFLEYIVALQKIYNGSHRERRGQLLRDAQEITRKSERTVLRYLGQDPQSIQQRIDNKHPIQQGRGRKKKFNESVLIPHIRALWIMMGRVCSIRMKEALKEWLKFYQHDDLTEVYRMQLLTMSRGTLERLLAGIRGQEKASWGLTTTKPANRKIKNLVPLNRYDQVITRPGFTQADTVAHCGNSAAGVFINTITLTDLFSGWTLNYGIHGKRASQVRRGFGYFKAELPFKLLAVNTDSGSEFINSTMIQLMGPINVLRFNYRTNKMHSDPVESLSVKTVHPWVKPVRCKTRGIEDGHGHFKEKNRWIS